jgi:hypothetical protein
MSASVLFLALDLALIVGAVLFLFLVIVRRGSTATNLALAVLLLVLAAAVWYTTIRTPPPLP